MRTTGFEPAAYRVGVCHSIQLSYVRINNFTPHFEGVLTVSPITCEKRRTLTNEENFLKVSLPESGSVPEQTLQLLPWSPFERTAAGQ